MVPHGFERRRQALEHRVAGVRHHGGLPVHQPLGPHHPATEGFADGLMSQAHAEQRHARRRRRPHQWHADARLAWGAGAGRNDDGRRVERERPLGIQRVVPVDHRIGAQLACVLDQVVGEAVVVVEDEKHDPRS